MNWIKLTTTALTLCFTATLALAATETVTNHSRLNFEHEPVRLRVDAPGEAGTFTLLKDGQPVAYQVEKIDDRLRIWVSVSLASGESAKYEIKNTPSPRLAQATKVEKVKGQAEISNGTISVRVGHGGPLLAVKAGDGPWRGKAVAEVPGTSTIEVTTGPIFTEARVQTKYPNGGHREFAVRLHQDRPYAMVTEKHSNAPELIFQINPGWSGTDQAVIRRWYNGPFSGAPAVEELALKPDATRVPGGIIHVLPRWTQAYDDGWFASVSDGKQLVGVLGIRPSQWVWPHDSYITLAVTEKGEASLRAASHRGARQWLLVAGERGLAEQAMDIATRTSFAPLDKLHNDYILDWPGLDEKASRPFGPKNFFSNQTNPTDMLRRWARSELQNVGKPTNSLNALYEAQAYLDPDWYGTYENHWSPLNPNFYTDFMKMAVLKTARLREHPEFDKLRARAEHVMRTDLAYSVTLPGGAGQECPGYQDHAAGLWAQIAPAAEKYLKFDLKSWPQWRATGHFFAHVSVPDGGNRRAFHPAGDTHPGRPDPTDRAKNFGYNANPRSWKTEELLGFGIIFRNKPGTGDETYLSFKAGPNRGHYHGDSLSFHLAFNARDTAPDHRVSYFERPGQEHMHNRLGFSSHRFDYANMDGYERTIAFKTSDQADIAVGQVESPRLREVKKLPPEDWDVAFPQQELNQPLVYRRSIILVRKGNGVAEDFFVIRDQFWSDPQDQIAGHFYLHTKGNEPKQDGRAYSFGNMTLYDATPSAGQFEPFHWTPDRGNLKGEATKGLRLSLASSKGYGEAVTILWPGGKLPEIKQELNRVTVGSVEIRFAGSTQSDAAGITIAAGGKPLLTLTEDDVDLNRSQGKIGLFVPAAGYPFGPIPEWLIEQRGEVNPVELTTP